MNITLTEPTPPAQPSTSVKAIISLVLGLSSFLICITGLPAAILGALALGDIGRRPRYVGGKGLAIAGIVTGVLGMGFSMLFVLLLPAVARVRDAALRTAASNQMRMVVLSMHTFESGNRALPDDIREGEGRDPRGVGQPNAKPLLSWRVRLLPMLDEGGLYREFKLDEPWDSPHNLKLVSRMPKVYESLHAKLEPGKTLFLRPKGKEMVLGAVVDGQPFNAWNLGGIPDGTSNTILVVEADPEKAVIWTKPDDLEVDLRQPRRGLGEKRGGFVAGFGDGTTRFIKPTVSDATIAELFTPNSQAWGQSGTFDYRELDR